MAYTVTKVHDHSVGDKKGATYDVTADAAEANISAASLGMKYLDYFHIGIQSITTSFYAMKINVDSSGTAANGGVGISGLTSGDQFFLTVYGR
jgi:hypothetical protein